MTELKDATYTLAQLEEIALADNGKEQLQGILSDRGLAFHHANNEETLIQKVIASNPFGMTSESSIDTSFEEQVEQAAEHNKSVPPIFGIASTIEANTGIVSLELINPKGTGSLRVRNYTNSRGEKKVLLDRHGEPWMFMITKNAKLDMSREDDRALYEHLLEHPYVIGGGGLNPSVKLINEGADSIVNVDKIELAIEAQNIVRKLNEEELRNFARICNVTVAHKKSAVVVKSELYNLCAKDPKFVIDMWNDPRKDLRALVYKGQDKGLIIKIDGVFKFDNLATGTTEDEMVLWFEKNPDILPGLRNKINQA